MCIQTASLRASLGLESLGVVLFCHQSPGWPADELAYCSPLLLRADFASFPCHWGCLLLVPKTLSSLPDCPEKPMPLQIVKTGSDTFSRVTTEPLPCPRNLYPLSSVQFSLSVLPNSLRPHELQHVGPPCPSPTPGVYANSCPLSQWHHPTISFSITLFSCLHQHQGLFWWVSSLHQVAKVLEFQLQLQSMAHGYYSTNTNLIITCRNEIIYHSSSYSEVIALRKDV